MIFKGTAILFIVPTLLLAATPLTAAANAISADPTAPPPHARARRNAFSEGAWTIEPFFGQSFRGDRSLTSTGLGVGYYLVDGLEARGEIVGYSFNQKGPNPLGAGLNIAGRYHFLKFGPISLFGDASGGIIEAGRDFPPQGTRFNFTYQAGVGATYQMTGQLHLMVRGSFQHVSNAFIEGRDHNPSYNGFGAWIGLIWSF